MPKDARPATKQDLNELRHQISDEMRAQGNELREEMRAQGNELREELRGLGRQMIEKMRDMQTEVLRAFHDWASPVEIKLRAIPPLDQRLALIEERVSRLERNRLQH